MKRSDLVERVVAPRYRIGKYVLNEYELRELMVNVAIGKIKNWKDIEITDDHGTTVKFMTGRSIPGRLTGNLYGMSLTVESTMKFLSLGGGR